MDRRSTPHVTLRLAYVCCKRGSEYKKRAKAAAVAKEREGKKVPHTGSPSTLVSAHSLF